MPISFIGWNIQRGVACLEKVPPVCLAILTILRPEAMHIKVSLLFLLEFFSIFKNQKWLAFANSIEPGQPAHLWCLTRLYTVGWLTSSSHLDVPNNDNGQWINPFIKFSRLRVNGCCHITKIINNKISIIYSLLLIHFSNWCSNLTNPTFMGSNGLMDKVSASQPQDHGFEPHTCHNNDSSYDTSTGCFQEADSRVI